jgi:hypothetical protein|tara:strand:- start:7268 stop:7495 length:228 start_codon:yes stop_codon:yes gene_type:complete
MNTLQPQSMTNTEEIYSEAILFILDSISSHEKTQLKDDIRLKLDLERELEPITVTGLLVLKRLIEASDLSRTIES